MHEAQVNGTQADETLDGGMADDTLAEETQAHGDGSDGRDVDIRRLRLSGFLRELVREEGRMEAAELLGVAYRTLVKAEESGEITGRMRDALERLLGTGDAPEVVRLRETVGEQEKRTTALESGMEALGKEMRSGLDGIRAAVSGKAGAEGVGQEQPGEQNGEGAGGPETGAAPPAAGLRPGKPFTERRVDPEIVTVQPADDDVEAYGPAWPLVEEWRKLRVGHPTQGKSLSWLMTEERLLVLELAMLEEHGLTLPPEKQPLRGFGRRGQTTHRWKALADARERLRKRKQLRWVRRVLTVNLWR